ncbi:MAG: hypothetical protein INH13_07770, partial [Cupriavidus sp.]|nr:hypothetical protein [Cupriavidus sp.]
MLREISISKNVALKFSKPIHQAHQRFCRIALERVLRLMVDALDERILIAAFHSNKRLFSIPYDELQEYIIG